MSRASSSDAVVIDSAFRAESFDTLAIRVPESHVRLRPHGEDDAMHIRGSVPEVPVNAAQALFDRRNISIRQSDGCVRILGDDLSTKIGAWRWRREHPTAVRFEISLPPSVDVSVQVPGGSIDAAHLGSTVDLTAQGGSVCARQLTGPVSIRGSGARATAQDCSGASLDLRWSSGEVLLKNITASHTTLRAASAPTTVETLHGPADLSVHGAPLTVHHVEGPCEATVYGAPFTYHGAPTGDTCLRAVGGMLRAHLPSSHPATLILMGAEVILDDTFSFQGERTARRIEGILNGGGPSLRLHAVQGSAQCRVESEKA